MPTSVDFTWHGESLKLLSSRAVWWPDQRALLIADVHLGKPAAFRASGAPVPEATTRNDLDRLSNALNLHSAERLIILGDFLHARAGRTTEVLDAAIEWRSRHPRLEVVLIRGNHDRRAGDLSPELHIKTVDPGWQEKSFTFLHEPDSAETTAPAFCGHLHPAVRLVRAGSPGFAPMRAACFWFRSRIAILPAFGSFTGCLLVHPTRTDHIFVVNGDEIVHMTGEPDDRDISKRSAHLDSLTDAAII